jgi:hypothetical protein
MKRRQLIVGLVGAAVGLAGCSGLSSNKVVDLTVFNDTEDPYNVLFEFYVPDGSRSDAQVWDTGTSGLRVPPTGMVERDGVVSARQYVIRYSVYRNNSRLTDEGHFHYYPSGEDDISFDIRPPGELWRR